MLAGIDVSTFNTLSSRTLDGLAFAFARATYGRDPDGKYASHTAAFRAAGLVTGAYHFGNGLSTGAQQAASFLAVAHGSDLLALDWEGDAHPMNDDQARDFVRAVKAAGRSVGLYHSRSGFPNIGQDWNWVAQWGHAVPTGLRWSVWQWQGSPLDRDLFNGDLAALRRLAGLSIPAPDTSTAQRSVYVTGGYWDYAISGTVARGYTISRVSRTTGGFGGTVGPELALRWGGESRRFVKLLSGVLRGHWLDLNDPNVSEQTGD